MALRGKTSFKSLFKKVSLSGVRNVDADHAASHLGKAQGIVTLIRGIVHHLRYNQVSIPLDLLIQVSHGQGNVFVSYQLAALMEYTETPQLRSSIDICISG